MSNNTPPAGVAGNTPQQQHTAAGSAATSSRMLSWAKNNKYLGGIILLIAAYTIVTTFVNVKMGLGGLLVFLLLMRYAYKEFQKNSKPSLMSLAGHTIAAVIALVVINSNFVQKPLELFNIAHQELGEVDMANVVLDCPDIQAVEAGDTFTLKKGCGEHIIRVPRDLDPWYVANDARFTGNIRDWIDADWHPTNPTQVLINELRWPEGVDSVEIQVLTEAEARSFKRAPSSDEADQIVAQALGE